MIDDGDLLRRYVETGSEEACTELVHRHIDFVYSAALRMTKSTHRAEDVTQNVFTDLCRKAKNLTDRQDLVGWLYISTRYASTMLIRRECRRELREHEAHLLSEQSPESACAIDWKQLEPVLDNVLGKLSTPDRDAILLRFFKNASFAEIGAALQLSESGARMRVDRAIIKTRKLLARTGISSTAVAFELALSAQPAVAAPAAFASTVSGTAMGAAISGTAAVTTVTGLLTLMNATKLTTLAVALVAAIGIGTVMKQEITQAQAAVLATGNDVSRMQDQLAEVTKQSEHAEAKRARLEKIAAHLHKSARKAGQNGPSTISPARPGPNLKALAKDPALEAVMYSSYLAGMHRTYEPLYRQLQFTPAQVQQFEAIVAKHAQLELDIALSATSQGITMDDPTVKDLNKQDQADLLTDLQGLVTAQQLTDFAKSQTGGSVTAYFAAIVNNTNMALTSQQSTALSQLIAAHTTEGKDGAGLSIDWDSVMANAPSVLSPTQASMLGSVHAQLESSRQVNQARIEAMRAASATSP